MYSVTWIENGKLFSISSPSLLTAGRVFYNLRIRCKLAARMWACVKKGEPTLIF